MKCSVYFMPGMAASPQIFEYIKLPSKQFDVHLMEWILPVKNESIRDYCIRLLDQIKHEYPVLIGVSFGGVIVQELSKLLPVKKMIIISSVKSSKEFPRRMRLSKATHLHKALPTTLIKHFGTIASYSKILAPKKIEMYNKYLSVNDPLYMDWALNTIINWDQEKAPDNLIHIHGDSDPVFPIKYIENCITVEGGTHVMIINRFRWFNEHLPQLILDN